MFVLQEMKPCKFDQIFATLGFFSPLMSIVGKLGVKLTQEKCYVYKDIHFNLNYHGKSWGKIQHPTELNNLTMGQ